MPKTWEISDIDGRNKRTVTLEQFRAEVETAKKRALEIFRQEAKDNGLSIHPRWR